MKACVLAAGPAGFVAAAQLRLAGWEVELLRAPQARRLRPARLRAADLVRLREIAALGNQDPSLLTFAPEFESWGLPDGPRYSFALQGFEWRADKWVQEDRLNELLDASVRSLGVKVRPLPAALRPPVIEDPRPDEPLRIVEVGPMELPLWSTGHEKEGLRIEACEIRLPFGRLAQVDACQVQRLEGCAAYLEPHADSGFVLSLYAASKYPLERALASLRNPRGGGPAAWRALFMVNPGAEVLWRRHLVGVTDFFYPGTFALGSALGEICPGVNLQLSESLAQADRLARLLTQPTPGGEVSPRRWMRLSETWSAEENKRLDRAVKRSEAGERLCLSEGPRRVVLPLTTLLPRPVRHFLKLPV